MSADEMLREILERLRRLESERPAAALPKPAAAKRMGISLTQLRRLVRSGAIATCEGSSRLIPVSEIERWTAPRAPRVSKRGRPGPRPRTGGYDPKEEAEKIRERLRRKP